MARLSAYFPGRIDRLFVNYVGVTVQQGDHLAELYSPDFARSVRGTPSSEELVLIRQEMPASFFARPQAKTLVASREKLRLFGLTPQQVQDVESGLFDSDELTIYSPIGGVVTHLAAREGDYLKTGDPIATVSDLSRLWLDLEAYESQFAHVAVGFCRSPLPSKHILERCSLGRVSFIEPIIDERTRTAAVARRGR